MQTFKRLWVAFKQLRCAHKFVLENELIDEIRYINSKPHHVSVSTYRCQKCQIILTHQLWKRLNNQVDQKGIKLISDTQ